MAEPRSAHFDVEADLRQALEDQNARVEGLSRENARLRAGIQWVRGMCTDGEPLEAIDAKLGEILDA